MHTQHPFLLVFGKFYCRYQTELTLVEYCRTFYISTHIFCQQLCLFWQVQTVVGKNSEKKSSFITIYRCNSLELTVGQKIPCIVINFGIYDLRNTSYSLEVQIGARTNS